MHQRDHLVCLYLKTWRVGFLLFPSPIPFKFLEFCKFRSCTISVGPAENYWVQDLRPAYLIFFLKKSVIHQTPRTLIMIDLVLLLQKMYHGNEPIFLDEH